MGSGLTTPSGSANGQVGDGIELKIHVERLMVVEIEFLMVITFDDH